MPTEKLENRRDPFKKRKGKLEPKVFFGSYMPFAGVKYYTILNERDVARRRHRIGPVGWCRRKQSLGERPARKAA